MTAERNKWGKEKNPPNLTHGVDLLGCDLRTWTRNVAYRVPLQVPNRGTGTTVLTYHLGFGIKLTTRESGCLLWPLIPTKTRLMAEDLAGPPAMGLTCGCVSAPFQNIWSTVAVVCVTSSSNKWLIRVNLMVARTTATITTTNRQSDVSQGYLAPCSGCSWHQNLTYDTGSDSERPPVIG